MIPMTIALTTLGGDTGPGSRTFKDLWQIHRAKIEEDERRSIENSDPTLTIKVIYIRR